MQSGLEAGHISLILNKRKKMGQSTWLHSSWHIVGIHKTLFFSFWVIFHTKWLSWQSKNPYELYIEHAFPEHAENEQETQTMVCFYYHCTVLSRWTRNEWLITCLHLALFIKSHTINNWLFSEVPTQTLKMACSFLPARKKKCTWFFWR